MIQPYQNLVNVFRENKYGQRKKENINQQKEILSLLAIERDSDIVKTTDFSYFFLQLELEIGQEN